MAVRFLFWCLTRHPAEMAMIKSKKNKDVIHYLVETNLKGLLIILFGLDQCLGYRRPSWTANTEPNFQLLVGPFFCSTRSWIWVEIAPSQVWRSMLSTPEWEVFREVKPHRSSTFENGVDSLGQKHLMSYMQKRWVGLGKPSLYMRNRVKKPTMRYSIVSATATESSL